MCDIHGKKLEYFCLNHDSYCCRKCKITLHELQPCECLHVRDVYDRLQLEMEEKIQDFVQLRDRSQRILDGSYQRNLLYRVEDEEKHLEKFYKDMKKKFKETKMKIKAFTAEELSEHLRGQLHALIDKHVPVKFHKIDRPEDMLCQLKNVKKQIHSANALLYSLPNYIEIAVDTQFMKLLTYNNDPIVIKGRPKYMTWVSSDDETDAADELAEIFENDDHAQAEDGQIHGKPKQNGGRVIKAGKEVFTKSAPVKKFGYLADGSESGPHSGVLKWHNNAPAFSVSASGPKQPLTNTKKERPPNKYEKQIEAVKNRMRMPPISRTPEVVRNIRERFQNKKTSRSVPDDVLTDRPVKKLFLKHEKSSKFKVKERFQLDGCEDAIVLRDCIVLSLGDKLQKRDRKTLKLGIEMKLTNCSTFCAISGAPTHVAVIQLQKCITVLDTQFGISVIYKIKFKQDYLDFCHIGTTDDGPHHPSYVFAAIYKGHPNQPVNCVDIIQAKPTHRPGRPPMFDIKAQELVIDAAGYRPKVIHGIGGFPDRHVVLGTGDAVVCVNEAGKLVWKTPVPREVSGVLCTKSYVYACLQDEKKIVTFNKGGFVTEEDVIPNLDIIPCKVSANWDIMLVKDFKTKAWVSVIFKQGLFIV